MPVASEGEAKIALRRRRLLWLGILPASGVLTLLLISLFASVVVVFVPFSVRIAPGPVWPPNSTGVVMGRVVGHKATRGLGVIDVTSPEDGSRFRCLMLQTKEDAYVLGFWNQEL
jgi:hypothetical protein